MPSPLRRLNKYLWRYKYLMVPGLLCALASAIFSLIVPRVVREAVDAVPRMVELHSLYGGTPAASELFRQFGWALVFAALFIMGLSMVSGFFSYLMRRTVVVASRHIEFDLRNRLYAHLQSLSGDFYSRYPTGDVMARSTSDIERVRRYIGPAYMYMARALTAIVAALVVMFIISPTLTWFSLIPMPFLAIMVFFVAKMVHVRTDRQQKQYATLTSRVQEALSGIRVMKAYAREDFEAGRFDIESKGYQRRTLDLAFVDAAFRPVIVVLIGLSVVLVVGVGGKLVIDGQLTIGNIAEFIIYVAILTWPVASFGFVISMVQQASASMSRIVEILDTEPAVKDGEQTDTSVKSIEGRISFENVRYNYAEDGPAVLDGLSFDVAAGSTLGIVGRTGSGKSTLIELIPRMMDASSGTVKVDGHDVKSIPLQTLRGAIGYVPQEVFLFSDTVGNNIAFGEMEAEQSEVDRAADEAELLTNVQDFPEGFETIVGERGITLSGGQKQRTAIARALIRNPKILVLDDALSAVDTNTEAIILAHLRKHYGRRTIVVVSHRISAVQEADQIIVLDEGRIAEHGTHEQLVKHHGLYADLYRKQQLEAELEAA